jgi:hypothetical protein
MSRYARYQICRAAFVELDSPVTTKSRQSVGVWSSKIWRMSKGSVA